MNIQVVHAPVHTREQVEEIVREAHRIADNWTATDEWRLAVFHEACTLLAARASVPLMPQAAPIDLSKLDGLRR